MTRDFGAMSLGTKRLPLLSTTITSKSGRVWQASEAKHSLSLLPAARVGITTVTRGWGKSLFYMAKGENSATRREGWRERLFEREILARCKPNGNIRRLTDAFTITMTKKLLFVVTLLCALSFGLMAADITGKWTSEQAGRNG